MRVAITGATGFVGRHFVDALSKRDAELVVSSRAPKASVSSPRSMSTVGFDISDPTGAYERLGQPNTLVHLAWGGLPNYRSEHHVIDELPKQLAFLTECLRCGLRHLVVAGTCLEYGLHEGCMIESMTCAPVIAYAIAKDRLRRTLMAMQNSLSFELTWLRIFYLYGPGQAPTSLYAQLNQAVESGAESFAMSPGDQIRDYLPIETAARFVADLSTRKSGAGVVNVCSGTPRSVESMARQWLSEKGAQLRLDLGSFPYPDYEPHAFWGSTNKLLDLVKSHD